VNVVRLINQEKQGKGWACERDYLPRNARAERLAYAKAT
jgi:hypothetical protein